MLGNMVPKKRMFLLFVSFPQSLCFSSGLPFLPSPGGMTWYGKCLVCKQEDLNSGPTEKHLCMSVAPVLEWREDAESQKHFGQNSNL